MLASFVAGGLLLLALTGIGIITWLSQSASTPVYPNSVPHLPENPYPSSPPQPLAGAVTLPITGAPYKHVALVGPEKQSTLLYHFLSIERFNDGNYDAFNVQPNSQYRPSEPEDLVVLFIKIENTSPVVGGGAYQQGLHLSSAVRITYVNGKQQFIAPANGYITDGEMVSAFSTEYVAVPFLVPRSTKTLHMIFGKDLEHPVAAFDIDFPNGTVSRL